MIGDYSLLFISFLCIINKAVAENYGWLTYIVKVDDPIRQPSQDIYFMESRINERPDTVDLRLYYECLCPDCIDLDRTQFKNVVNILSPYLNIKTYPYGNARTIDTNGKVEFRCQHGPKECYGNKLHACSLKHIANHTQALLFNICMMEPKNETRGSDDTAAARCSSEMNVNKDTIIQCARGKEGIQLLKYYGEESQKANFNYVPYVLINGVEWKGTDLMLDICAAFQNAPEICVQRY